MNQIMEHFDDEDDFERCLNSADVASCGRKEAQFVDETKARYEEWGSKMYLSEKQAKWLKDIAGWEED